MKPWQYSLQKRNALNFSLNKRLTLPTLYHYKMEEKLKALVIFCLQKSKHFWKWRLLKK